MKVFSGLALFACFSVSYARLSTFEKEVITPSTRRDLQDNENCKICDRDTEKDQKPDELYFEFTDNWNVNSAYMGEDDSNCHTINPDDIVREEDGGIEVVVKGYGRFKSLNMNNAFKVVLRKGAFTYMQFKLKTGGSTSCYIHTSCSEPLHAGDNHGPFKLLDLGSCPAPPPEGECVICGKNNKDGKGAPITVQYVAAGKDSAYQDGRKASCVAGDYPSPATVLVNGQTFMVEDGQNFTFTPANSAETTFSINGEECFIHTSCSVPIVVGDQIGPFKIMGGYGCGPPPPPPKCGEECTICDKENKNRPESLTLKYHSDGMNSQYQPEDKASCRAGLYPTTTTITVQGQAIPVADGVEFTITADGKFDAETEFEFSTGSVSDCYIHTSCSVPLVTGDRIGPFEVISGGQCEPLTCDECITATSREVNGTWVVDVEFDYVSLSADRNYTKNCDSRDKSGTCVDGSIVDFTPLGNDWVGLYPCEDALRQPLPFNREPKTWAYTCYDQDIGRGKGRCARGPAIGQNAFTFADETAPAFTIQGIYKPLSELVADRPGCYVALLNRYEGYSPPPYYNLCVSKEFQLGSVA